MAGRLLFRDGMQACFLRRFSLPGRGEERREVFAPYACFAGRVGGLEALIVGGHVG